MVGALPKALTDQARAKVNLSLCVLGRRADGYHEIESLVAFAAIADHLTLTPGGPLSLEVTGPNAEANGATDDNLVLKAARSLASRLEGLTLGHFTLAKHLPVAAGLGGGSADAAAALRLLARASGLSTDEPRLTEAARATGADVTVCLAARARVMRGIGHELLSPIGLPRLPAVLVNPGVAIATKDVFARLDASPGERTAQGTDVAPPTVFHDLDELVRYLVATPNDLTAPAIAIAPVIAEVLSDLEALDGIRLARMSGSGATCFGLFGTEAQADAAASWLRRRHPKWWIEPTVLS